MWILDYQNLPGVAWFLGGLVASLIAGFGLTRLVRREERVDSLLILAAPASLYVLLVKSWMAMILAPHSDWTAGRFSPTYSLLKGFTLYYPVDSGPIYNTIYPPMSYLAFLPAAIFSTPTPALLAGALLSQCYVLLPVLAICFSRHGDEGKTRTPLLSLFVYFGFWKFLASTTLGIMLGSVHADAPAIGFATMACGVLYARRFDAMPSARTMLASAAFASLSIWSKQIFAPLFVLLLGWMLLTHGPRAALKFGIWLATALAAVSTVFLGTFGLRPMAFNILELPSSHPWTYAPDYTKGFLVFLVEMASVAGPVLLGLLGLAYVAAKRPSPVGDSDPERGRFDRVHAYFRGNFWLLFAGLALAMIPLGLLGRIKLGGHINSYFPPAYFLCLSGCLLLLDWAGRNSEAGRGRVNLALKAVVLAWPLAPLLMVNSDLLQQYGVMIPAAENPQEYAYRYSLKHPGEAYFPYNTLSTLMAEGNAYHFESGMVDRDLGHVAPSDTHFRRHLPGRLKLVAYPPARPFEWSMRYLPEFKRRVVVDELPGWICYERD